MGASEVIVPKGDGKFCRQAKDGEPWRKNRTASGSLMLRRGRGAHADHVALTSERFPSQFTTFQLIRETFQYVSSRLWVRTWLKRQSS
jgi:hypothetical protein